MSIYYACLVYAILIQGVVIVALIHQNQGFSNSPLFRTAFGAFIVLVLNLAAVGWRKK